MKLGEILKTSCSVVGLGHLVLTNGKPLITEIKEYLNIKNLRGDLLVGTLADLIADLPDDEKEKVLDWDVSETQVHRGNAVSSEIRELATPDKGERTVRNFLGAMMCIVMAICNIAITASIVIVCVQRHELPSATLVATIIIPTMCISWFYMGVINKERRDILSAVFGDNLKNGTIGQIVDVVRNRNKPE